MKKLYSKPEILFESFATSTNIAAGCRFITKLQAEGGCGYDDGRNGVVFITKETGCTYTQVDGDSLCYHVPNEDYDIFNS